LIAYWGPRPIVDISRRDVVERIEQIVDDGRPAMARKVFESISKLFAWAMSRDLYDIKSSPARDVKIGDIVALHRACAARPAPSL
jgi:hypothetical protein